MYFLIFLSNLNNFFNKNINLKRIMGVISIGNLVGHDVVISADGPDEEEALEAIVEFLS